MSDRDDTSIYELRLYDVAAGRLSAEIGRMHRVAIAGEPATADGPETTGPSMFDRYGIPRPLGAWSIVSGERMPGFGYILRWDSLAQRDAAFPPFWADPLWKQIRDLTDDGVPMVERTEDWLLRPSPFMDAALRPGAGGGDAFTEMLIQRVENGYALEAGAAHAHVVLPLLVEHGAAVIGLFDLVIGPDMPAMITFLAWPDRETQEAAWQALHLDKTLRDEIGRQKRAFGQPLVRSSQHNLMTPVSFGLPTPGFGRTPT